MIAILLKIKEFLEIAFCYCLAGLTIISVITLICCVLYAKDKEAIEAENNRSKG